LSSTGGALDYSTFLGGSTCNIHTIGYGVTVDSAENAFVAGSTQDGTFPTVNPLFPSNSYGGPAVFVSEFNTRASALLFSTLLGAGGGALGYAIHADNYGNVYVAGNASSSSYLPTTAGAFQTNFGGGATDAFALRIGLTQADLALTNSAPSTILSGTNLVNSITVTNNGPDVADAVADGCHTYGDQVRERDDHLRIVQDPTWQGARRRRDVHGCIAGQRCVIYGDHDGNRKLQVGQDCD